MCAVPGPESMLGHPSEMVTLVKVTLPVTLVVWGLSRPLAIQRDLNDVALARWRRDSVSLVALLFCPFSFPTPFSSLPLFLFSVQ